MVDSAKGVVVICCYDTPASPTLLLLSEDHYHIKEKYAPQCPVLAIRITETYLLVALERTSTDYQLLLFHRIQDKFFEKSPLVHRLGSNRPVALTKVPNSISFILLSESK